ncbi:MAG: beta-galactosidase, partial [Bryobacteraceae bacterium]
AQPVRIADVRFDQDRFRRGDPVTGRFVVSGAAPGLALRMNFFDNYGRLLATRDLALSPGQREAAFSFPSQDALTRLAWVEGRLLEEGRERHRKRAQVFILQPRRWDDFDVVMYLFGPDPAPGLWPTIEQRLRAMQVTTLSSYPLELSRHANFGVQAQTRISGQESPDGEARKPYLEQKRRWAETHDKKYLARLYCLSDPAYRNQQEREIEKLVTPWVPFSPMSYYIYEEPSLTCYTDAFDLCFSPHCMARMREWLKREYGSLEALNRQWGTSFTRWEDVTPDTTEEAQRRGNYSSWADHRTFMEEVYAENYAYVRDLLHRHDPEGLVLLSGTQESVPHNGCDYSRLNYIVGHLNPYTGGNQLEFLRSFNPGLHMSAGTGYGVKGRRALYNLYNGLFHGFTAGAYIFWQYSILNPDYRFSGSAESIRAALEEIREGGVARLLRGAQRDNDGIAIHYSFPSIHGSWIVDGRTTGPDENPNKGAGPTFRKFEANRDGWVNLLKDLGFGFDFIARQQIEAGELKTRGFRALILPFSVALTAGEVCAIREFVEAGGVLIADG